LIPSTSNDDFKKFEKKEFEDIAKICEEKLIHVEDTLRVS
jgi:hypothetical protein